ncbi:MULTISPECIES: 16S rRNA (guanine(527)-N(7))-methyltransferase RsmG [unclassified Yoonia]|uniref:16S rRNA (guanine(527)-N(7))-methyltransferase RsmG n=1 Tax=unclassified Yoonia TaxID=2629118 RepID=UPI002AFE99C2|nr:MULTISPECIES: 16S rRNA (guanine(527)-N(7))-methyltransferase RsmG [unclassified Yoonia]
MVDVGGVDVSRETMGDLQAFAALVLKWTPKINLISASSEESIWDRHVVDSVQIYRHAPADLRLWLDIGSGGGFPGIVAAILGKAKHPDARFVLIESDQRKAAFLRTAIRDLDLAASVLADRIESLPPTGADVVSARALGSLALMLPLISHHMRPEGTAILHKGRQAANEIADARREWRFDLEEAPSMTDPDGRLLLIQRIHRAA